jgi:hypothetical protein
VRHSRVRRQSRPFPLKEKVKKKKKKKKVKEKKKWEKAVEKESLDELTPRGNSLAPRPSWVSQQELRKRRCAAG